MLESKKEELRREIARRERELEKLDALPDLTQLTDGTVLALFVAHGRSQPYTYVAYLTGGKFYLTGATSPNKVSADELAVWLTTSGRKLIGLAVIGEVAVVGALAFDISEALLDSLAETAEKAFGRAGSERRDRQYDRYGPYAYGD